MRTVSRNSTTASLKSVVAVARDHVAGPGDVDESGVGHQLEQLLGALLAQQVAHPAAHEQRRDGRADRAARCRGGRRRSSRRAGLVGRAELAAHEARVPVPHPPAVGALAEVLLQAVEVLRAGAGAGCRPAITSATSSSDSNPSRLPRHEVADARHAAPLDPRRDVDEHQRAWRSASPVRSSRDGGQRRDPAERRADQRRRARQRPATTATTSRGERVERVVAVGRPGAVAVAAQVDRERVPALVRASAASCPRRGGSGRRRATGPPAAPTDPLPRLPPVRAHRRPRARSSSRRHLHLADPPRDGAPVMVQ